MQAKGQLWPTRAFSAECAQNKQQVREKAVNPSRQEGGRLLIKRAPLMIKPSKPPQGAKGKPQNRASPVGNAPLLVLRITFLLKGSMSLDSQVAALPYESSSFATPKGALLPALCYELIMGANVEWRANLPLRGRCRRQKGCISIRHSLVGMFSLAPRARLYGLIKRGGRLI